jgi:hypothetical protein
MKNTCLISTLLLFLLFSCNSISYLSENQNQKTGLDFTKGTWLLNDIDCPKDVYYELSDHLTKDFGKQLNENLFLARQQKSSLIPKKVVINPSKIQLLDLKKNIIYDYFINVKAEKIKEDLGNVDFTNHKINKKLINRSLIILEVYDLNLGEIIYSKKITGTIEIKENNNSDLNFNKNTNQIIISCYKKIWKDILKKSILNKN